MVAPVLKSFQAEVRPKAHGMSQKHSLLPSPIPPGVAKGGQLPLEAWEKPAHPHRKLHPILSRSASGDMMRMGSLFCLMGFQCLIPRNLPLPRLCPALHQLCYIQYL